MPQQGSLGEDIEDNNTTTKSAIEEAGNTDSSTESEQDVTVSDIEATTEGIVGENILEYDADEIKLLKQLRYRKNQKYNHED